MKVFIRVPQGNYFETSMEVLQYRIDHYYGVIYTIDKITDTCIYICEVETE